MKSDKTYSQPPARGLAYRVAIPVAALSLYATLAGLWLSGSRALDFDTLRLLGVEPFSFPFLDAHAVLAAAECGRQGIDVYLSNPCDALGRPHAYSPLWLLAIVPAHLGVGATWWVGASLGVLFILSWPLVLRPRTPKELLILGSAAISPMTVYALERANNDLVVFLLVVCGGIMFTWSRPLRLFAYGPFIAGGLLKYYPFVLLVLVARESGREVLIIATATGFALGIFGVVFGADLRTALANIPTASSYFTDAFSARNLPFGFAEALGGGGISRTFIAAVTAGDAHRTGHRPNASHDAADRAGEARLGGERGAVPRHRRPVDYGVLLCRPERRLSGHFSSAGNIRPGLPAPIG